MTWSVMEAFNACKVFPLQADMRVRTLITMQIQRIHFEDILAAARSSTYVT